MNKYTPLTIIQPISILLAVFLFCYPLFAISEELSSLRGAAINTDSQDPDIKQWQDDKPPIPRDYVQQPPLIPHSIEKYQINRKFNKCLTCHSWTNYKKYGATKVSQTHFADRDKNITANIAARRYFCTQCHVPQVDAPPLIDNQFQPLKTIKRY